MKIIILTLFPEFFASPLQSSILKRAQSEVKVEFEIINIRDFTTDKHRTTDDRPFGGGAGMVMKLEPIFRALDSFDLLEKEGERRGQRRHADGKHVLLTSAKGDLFRQETARSLATFSELYLICGHYEGVDERVSQYLIDSEMRIGDFVVTGGEGPAMIIADAVTRLLPGVLGNQASLEGESHDQPGKLAHPQFTRPEVFNDWPVPEVLLSGHHADISAWREQQSQVDSTQIQTTEKDFA